MDPAQRLAPEKAFQRLDAQGELPPGFSPLPTAKVKKRHAWPDAVASWDLGRKGPIGPAAHGFIESADLRFIGGDKRLSR
jgi:hypothetical protein